MKKIFVLIVLVFVFFPVPLRGESGLYNTWSGLIWCEPSACVHEVGHKLDDMSGWVSKSDEFQNTVKDMGLDLWENPQEDYAEIFDFADGKKKNMPAELQSFYDWELAERLLYGICN